MLESAHQGAHQGAHAHEAWMTAHISCSFVSTATLVGPPCGSEVPRPRMAHCLSALTKEELAFRQLPIRATGFTNHIRRRVPVYACI